ncbi:RagB/SusD family nutrient uptake outer membrane protein [Sunxiuqinia sp. sy24]|uniref:RagB/SusD family nutrient uptake outer membrane protein n=1 Tax=Sunxiuqinia sp. sy24 TaxID=3461495 RepID=UPI004045A230
MRNILLIVLFFWSVSCSDYLDVVPDNIATIDDAFIDRSNAERFLFTCYSYLPNAVNHSTNPALIGGDELWLPRLAPSPLRYGNVNAWRIARGEQNINSPYLNYWDGGNNGTNLFIAIRDCNIFLENIDTPRDLDDYEKNRWIAEVKFLKAYYHFYLMRMYGPIPIVRENKPVSSSVEEVRVYREPVADVVEYIAELLDEAAPHLPLQIQSKVSEMGRITQPIALSLKAQAYLLAASPLFNGNRDFSVIDKRGVQLFAQDENPDLWVKAAEYALDAIESAEEAGHSLHYFDNKGIGLSDSTMIKMNYRGAVTEKWNDEIIWGSMNSMSSFLSEVWPSNSLWISNYYAAGTIQPTLRMAELFYSDNGIPIEEDPSWDYTNRYETVVADERDKFYIKPGAEVHKLNLNREPRYHASIIFDKSRGYGFGRIGDDNMVDFDTRIEWWSGTKQGTYSGYYVKKLIHYGSEARNSNASGSLVFERYFMPILRLADLYLMYAEALNEVEGPVADVHYYVNEVRKRSGLDAINISWAKSNYPSKPESKEGMREIIRRERLIELSFEGHRFWDLRRWKLATQYMNQPILGWRYYKDNNDLSIDTQFEPSFTRKDYLWPIKQSSVFSNTNLEQNPGW